MILYHFTSLQHWRLIQRQGLTKGGMPIELPNRTLAMRTGVQWLTVDPDWFQDWDVNTGLPYRRTELRLAVDIPDLARNRLVSWPEYAQRRQPDCAQSFARFASSRHWALFLGQIPCDWILAAERNPIAIDLSLTNENQ